MNIVRKIDIGFVLYFGVLVGTIFFGTRFFGTNDDLLMMLFASGHYSGEPSEYITYQNIVVGQFLKPLYIVFSSINWYVAFLTFVQFLSFTMLYLFFRRLVEKSTLLFLFVLPMLYFIVEFNLYLQFTKVAFLANVVGLLYLVKYMYSGENKNLVYSYLFIILGYLIREYSTYGAILVISPVLLLLFVKNWKMILDKKVIVYAFLLLSSVAALKTYNDHYYSNNASWHNYRELIKVRGMFYHDRSITRECFHQNGKKFNLSKNDVETAYKWTNDDNSVYTPEMFNHVVKNCSQLFDYKYERIQNVNFLTYFLKRLSSFDFIFIYLFCIYLLFLMPVKYKVFILSYMLYFVLILFYLSTVSLANRVAASITLEFYLLLLFLTYVAHVNKYYIYQKIVSFLVIGLFLVYSYTSLFGQVVYKKKPFQIDNEMKILKDQYVIVIKSKNFMNDLTLDTDFNKMFSVATFYYSGWNLGSPDNVKVLDGLDNFYELILEKENVLLYVDAHRLPVIKQYLFEHYHKDVSFKKVQDNYYKVDRVKY